MQSVIHSFIVQREQHMLFEDSTCRRPYPGQQSTYGLHGETRILLQILSHYPRANDYHASDRHCVVNDIKAELHKLLPYLMV